MISTLRLIALALTFLLAPLLMSVEGAKPRVFVFTDINIDSGDPDDRQSLIHLCWYTDELQVEGIVPDRWDASGYEACMLVLDAYQKDFDALGWKERGLLDPKTLRSRIARDRDEALNRFSEVLRSSDEPLWVLVGGNMVLAGDALRQNSDSLGKIRLLTIGTDRLLEQDRQWLPEDWERFEPCKQPNWNGHGRDAIFSDPRFHSLWWVEMNWTYAGMFSGEEPTSMFQRLLGYGQLGAHMMEVTKNEPWARYFRVGDTPTVLYLIDPRRSVHDPTRSSWAGRFVPAMPDERPGYFTDDPGSIPWCFRDPCAHWENHALVAAHARETLEGERPNMYEALIAKLEALYTTGP